MGPVIPEGVTAAELDRQTRDELWALRADTADKVARHLVMAGRLLDDDPEAAWEHALVARSRAARIGVVREAVGLAAYRTGRYAEAIAELRTARRVTGSDEHLPIIADCERGLGRPERALTIAASSEARALDPAGQIEMLLVTAGARTDLGQLDAAVLTLQVQALNNKTPSVWLARLRSAYSDALAAVGRTGEAREWLELAAAVDETGETGAAERLAEQDGLVFRDLDEEFGPDDVAESASPGENESKTESGADNQTASPTEPQVEPQAQEAGGQVRDLLHEGPDRTGQDR